MWNVIGLNNCRNFVISVLRTWVGNWAYGQIIGKFKWRASFGWKLKLAVLNFTWWRQCSTRVIIEGSGARLSGFRCRSCSSLGKWPNLLLPQILHLQYGDNRHCWLTGVIMIKGWNSCKVCSSTQNKRKHSTNGSYCIIVNQLKKNRIQ